MTAISIRFRVDFDGVCSVGFGKIALLEGIGRTGSLSQAARDQRMSYRRARLLVESMNQSFDQKVVVMNSTGKSGRGTAITEFGNELVTTLRSLDAKLAKPARRHLHGIATHVVQRKRAVAKSKASPRSLAKTE